MFLSVVVPEELELLLEELEEELEELLELELELLEELLLELEESLLEPPFPPPPPPPPLQAVSSTSDRAAARKRAIPVLDRFIFIKTSPSTFYAADHTSPFKTIVNVNSPCL